MSETSVNFDIPSYYIEPETTLYRFRRRLTFKSILNFIRRSVKTKNSFTLLEIGSGSGYFLSFMESEFPGASLTSIEYDPRLIPFIRRRVKNVVIHNDNAESFILLPIS